LFFIYWFALCCKGKRAREPKPISILIWSPYFEECSPGACLFTIKYLTYVPYNNNTL
jgi:hypothetical protein